MDQEKRRRKEEENMVENLEVGTLVVAVAGLPKSRLHYLLGIHPRGAGCHVCSVEALPNGPASWILRCSSTT
jgi:hypothetical protein